MGLFNRKKKENKAEAPSTGDRNVGNVTLYVPGTDISNWKEELEKAVGQHITGMEDEDGHTNVHLKDGTIFLVSIVENPEEVERQTIGMANFFSQAPKLRPRDEIMDMQDLVFRYHWACLESRVKHFDVKKLNLEIVYEWHYALNWLTGFDGAKNWDEVSLRA